MKSKFIDGAKLLVKKGDSNLLKNGPKGFAKVAHDLLLDKKLHEHFDFHELARHSFQKNFIKDQNFKFLEFSDLPVTIARGEKCFIDVYFWRRRPTVIHNHHFMGAFQCLIGANIDQEYKFKKTRSLGKFHDLGTLKLHESRDLKPGDVSAIDILDKFIHQTHHQADLTVNLCFRTSDQFKKNLSNYTFTGLRYEKHPHLVSTVERLIRFSAMGDINVNELDLSPDEAIGFLIETHGSKNIPLNKIRDVLEKKIKKELKLDVPKLLFEHEKMMDDFENSYN